MGPISAAQMYMVVGFEVMACSIARVAGQKPSDVSCIDSLEGKPPAPQEVTKGMAGTSLSLPAHHRPPARPVITCRSAHMHHLSKHSWQAIKISVKIEAYPVQLPVLQELISAMACMITDQAAVACSKMLCNSFPSFSFGAVYENVLHEE